MASKHRILDNLHSTIDALKKAGADYAEVGFHESSHISLSLREGRVIETNSAAGEGRISMEAHVGDRRAEMAPDTQRADMLRDAVAMVVENARQKSPNPHTAPVDQSLLSKIRHNRGLDLRDKTKPDIAAMIAAMQDMETAALSVKGVILSEGASASWSEKRYVGLTSNGDIFESHATMNSLSISVVAGHDGEKTTDSAYAQARHRSDLRDPVSIGQEAGTRAAAAINPQRPPRTGRLPIVFSPEMSAGLLAHFINAAAGSNIMLKQSFITRDMLGQAVMSPSVTIADDPHRLRGLASSHFNSAGMATRAATYIQDGVLRGFFLGLESARRLGLPLTDITGGPGNICIAAGPCSPDQLIADIADGFYVTDVMGQGVKIINGDYSRGAKGFWIRNGVLSHPVAEATIAGNLRDMFMNMTPANDLDQTRDNRTSPTLQVEGMTIA